MIELAMNFSDCKLISNNENIKSFIIKAIKDPRNITLYLTIDTGNYKSQGDASVDVNMVINSYLDDYDPQTKKFLYQRIIWGNKDEKLKKIESIEKKLLYDRKIINDKLKELNIDLKINY